MPTKSRVISSRSDVSPVTDDRFFSGLSNNISDFMDVFVWGKAQGERDEPTAMTPGSIGTLRIVYAILPFLVLSKFSSNLSIDQI